MSNMRQTASTGGTTWKKPLPPALDDCYWKIGYQKWKWKTAEIVVKFTKIERGIKLGLWGNEEYKETVSPRSLIKPVVPDGEQIVVGTEYKLNAKQYSMIMIAYPYIVGS